MFQRIKNFINRKKIKKEELEMITKKENEAMLFLCSNNFMYLAKLFKFMFYLDLLTYKETGKRFFTHDYLIDPTCPVPVEIFEYMKNFTFLEKYKDNYALLIETGNKIHLRNISRTKIRRLVEPKQELLINGDINRINIIKNLYGPATPSSMHERDLIGKVIFKKAIENGCEGKILNIDDYLKLIPTENKKLTKEEIKKKEEVKKIISDGMKKKWDERKQDEPVKPHIVEPKPRKKSTRIYRPLTAEEKLQRSLKQKENWQKKKAQLGL